MQGRSDDQRELLDAESVAGHLLKSDSMFAFLAAHRSRLFPEEMFADLFPSRRGRPSVPAEKMVVERGIAWLTRGNRKLRYRRVAKNNHWLHHRSAALNLRRMLTMGLTHTGATWALA